MSAWQAAAAGLALLLAACSGSEEEPQVERPVDSIYNAAMEQLLDANYEEAAKTFEEVERQHPYSIWAAKAQVMSAYAYFRRDNYDDAINAADRFIQLHPTSPDAPYAYYLKALAYYEQIVDVGRDQRTTGNALEALEDVIRRFPETQYARDASLKLDLTRDHLAGKEMAVGRFYLKRGELTAAINRFKRVIERHQTTSQVPEALLRLTEAYTALGLTNEARRMTAILGYNYPGSPWYADAYELVEGVEVADFPRPDDRVFYERWFDPDATIAKAERRDVPNLAPGAGEAAATVAATSGSGPDAGLPPGATRAVIRDPLPPPSEAVPAPPPSKSVAMAPPEAQPAPATEAADRAPAAEAATTAPAAEPLPSARQIAPPAPASNAPEPARAKPMPEASATAATPDGAPSDETIAPAAKPESSKTVTDGAKPTATQRSTLDTPASTQSPKPASVLTSGERAALLAEAESQALAAREAAGDWRRAQAQAATDAGRKRAQANARLSETAAAYWEARRGVVAADGDGDVGKAELKLAEASVDYWTAARDAAEDSLAREHAGQALAQAEKVLRYWRENGSRPGWLERTVRSVI